MSANPMSQTQVITTSIIVADPLKKVRARCGLRPLSIHIDFMGELPSNISQMTVPLQISVALPMEYGVHILPILCATLAEDDENTDVEPLDFDLPPEPEEYPSSPVTEHGYATIPFLPLGGTFDPNLQECWATLWPEIQDWLINIVVESDAHEWRWGVEAFWMAFIAANPRFPGGQWPYWNSYIALQGDFIQVWMEELYGGNGYQYFHGSPDSDSLSRSKIWAKFQALFHTYCPAIPLL
ncbi:hypothetical protein BD779DRAFT_1563695 [Infundibulicybe gibba]|nr:hypothetical protein BD779DRAFT_1563695 [Infundibulicybe gibba]